MIQDRYQNFKYWWGNQVFLNILTFSFSDGFWRSQGHLNKRAHFLRHSVCTGCPQKMLLSDKIAITTLKLIQNAKVWGVLEQSGYLHTGFRVHKKCEDLQNCPIIPTLQSTLYYFVQTSNLPLWHHIIYLQQVVGCVVCMLVQICA